MNIAERRYLEESKTAAAYWPPGLPEAVLASLEQVANRIESLCYLVQMAQDSLPASTDSDPTRSVLAAMSDMTDRCFEHANSLGGELVCLLKMAQREGWLPVQTDKNLGRRKDRLNFPESETNEPT